MGQFLPRWSNEHVPHEQSMVGSSTDDAYADAVTLIPPSVAINNVDAISSIEIVDSTFSVDFPHLEECRVSTEVQIHVIKEAEESVGWKPRHKNGHAGPIPA